MVTGGMQKFSRKGERAGESGDGRRGRMGGRVDGNYLNWVIKSGFIGMRYNSLEKNSSYSIFSNVNLKVKQRDFPGGPVIESPPAKAEDTGLICGLEDPTCHGATKPICHNH